MPEMKRSRKPLHLIILVVIGLFLAFIFAEIALRLSAPEWLQTRMEKIRSDGIFFMGSDEDFPVIRENNKIKSLIPDSNFKINHFEYENLAHIDNYGGRVTQNNGQEDLAVFLGDSFTFGVGVEDRETFVNLLSRNSRKYRNINLGVPGGTITNQLDILEMRHKELGNPKLYVFTVFLGNDLIEILDYYRNENQQNNKNSKSQIYDLFERINKITNRNKFLSKSYSIQFIRQKVLNILNSGQEKLMDPIFMTSIKNNTYLPSAVKFYNESLVKLEKLSEELDFEFIFIVIPDINQIDQERMSSKAVYYDVNVDDLDFGLPNRAIRKILNQHKIRFLDVTDCLKNDPNLNSLYYIYDNHLTKDGHLSVSKCIQKSEYYDEIIQ